MKLTVNGSRGTSLPRLLNPLVLLLLGVVLSFAALCLVIASISMVVMSPLGWFVDIKVTD